MLSPVDCNENNCIFPLFILKAEQTPEPRLFFPSELHSRARAARPYTMYMSRQIKNRCTRPFMNGSTIS